jgi:hypothetical protein
MWKEAVLISFEFDLLCGYILVGNEESDWNPNSRYVVWGPRFEPKTTRMQSNNAKHLKTTMDRQHFYMAVVSLDIDKRRKYPDSLQ